MSLSALSTMSRAALCALLGLCLLAGLSPPAGAASAGPTFAVTRTADDNQPGSLRYAIGQAEATDGSTVVFQIPAGDPGFVTTGNPTMGTSTTATITLALGPLVISTPGSLYIAGGNTPSAQVVVDGAKQSRVFTVASGTVGIGSLTIQNGSASQSNVNFPESEGGGGILNKAALTLNSCTLNGNTTDADGGGVNNSGANASLRLYLQGFIFSGLLGNRAAGRGGAVANSGTLTLSFDYSGISGNTAAFGGGVANMGTMTASARSASIGGNTATVSGGGLYNTGTATLYASPNSGLSLSGNTAQGSAPGAGGGGAFNSGSLTLQYTPVRGNSAAGEGGGIDNAAGGVLSLNAATLSANTVPSTSGGSGGAVNNAGTAQITDCSILSNVGGNGGGLNSTGTAQMTNCLVVNNAGVSAGGMRSVGVLTLINSTFTTNTSSGAGGAGGLLSGPATLLNDIFYFDTSSAPGMPPVSEIATAPGTFPFGPFGPTVSSSIVQGGFSGAGSGAGNSSADPMFVRNPLTNPPSFGSVDPGDEHLQPKSPAIQAGQPGTPSDGVPLTDLDGLFRPVPPGRPCLGAYEVRSSSVGILSAQGGFSITGIPNVATLPQVVAKFLPAGASSSYTDVSGYAAAVDFGDGSGSTAGVVSLAPSGYPTLQVTGSHTYAAPGRYTVTTVITGRSSAGVTAVSTALVQPAPAADVTSQVSVFRGGFYYNRFTKRYSQTVTITNTSAAAITGPISLALDGLTSGAAALNAAGTTQYAPPTGSPYLTVQTGSLAPGATTSLFFRLTNPGGSQINYTPRVLAGPGAR